MINEVRDIGSQKFVKLREKLARYFASLSS